MEYYKNLNGNSSIIAYKTYDDKIAVKFRDGKTYTYSYYKAGKEHVDNMKILANNGCGLNSYIMRHVKYKYDNYY